MIKIRKTNPTKMSKFQLELGSLLVLLGLLIVYPTTGWTIQSTSGFVVSVVGLMLVYLKLVRKFRL